MLKFRRKFTTIEAVQWHPDVVHPGVRYAVQWPRGKQQPYVLTAHGQNMILEDGDWIIPELDRPGHFYPCKPDIFAATYEPWEDDSVAHAHDTTLVEVTPSVFANIDMGIAPLVRALNILPGVTTYASCQGHPHSPYETRAYVSFTWRGIDMELLVHPDVVDQLAKTLIWEWNEFHDSNYGEELCSLEGGDVK